MPSFPQTLTVREVGDEEFLTLARATNRPVPVEQSPVWDAFDAAVPGRRHLGRLAVQGTDGVPVAVISVTEFDVRGFRYGWAKHGPIMLHDEDADSERAVREALVDYVRTAWPTLVFLRMHARHPAPDLRELLQSVTYDHTVIIDLTLSEEEILGGMSKRGRYRMRKVWQDADMVVTEEDVRDPSAFAELYDIYRETAARDRFGIYPPEVYLDMLRSLPGHARMFVARRHDAGPDGTLQPGRAISWVLAVTYDDGGMDYYAAGNAEARECNAALAIKWHIFTTLKSQGVRQYDLMGVGSDRAPTLMGVREFKQQFGEIVEVPGAWDVALKPWRYRALVLALRVKRALGR
jgi:hypothetical protein